MTVIFSPWLNSIEAPWWEPPAANPLTESPSAIQPEQNDNVLVKSKRVRHFFIDPTVLYHNWTVRLYVQHHILNIVDDIHWFLHLLKNLPIQSLHQSPTLSVYFFDSFKEEFKPVASYQSRVSLRYYWVWRGIDSLDNKAEIEALVSGIFYGTYDHTWLLNTHCKSDIGEQ